MRLSICSFNFGKLIYIMFIYCFYIIHIIYTLITFYFLRKINELNTYCIIILYNNKIIKIFYIWKNKTYIQIIIILIYSFIIKEKDSEKWYDILVIIKQFKVFVISINSYCTYIIL